MTSDGTQNFARRLVRIGLAVIFITAAASWLSFDASRQVSDRAHDLVATHVPQLRTISALQDSVNRRVLHLYLYYATMDDKEWHKLAATRSEFAHLLDAVSLSEADSRQLQDLAATFDLHAQIFETEMTKGSERSWDALREHLADSQVAADELTHRLGELAGEIREQAGAGGNLTMTELSRLNYIQLIVMVAMLLIGVLVVFILRGRLRDQNELFHRAYYDPMTQLPNRSRLEQDWKRRLHSEISNDSPCALLAIQLDRFQLLNSTYGYSYGDSLIQVMSSRLIAACAETDTPHTVYQFALAKWLVLFDGAASPEVSQKVARQILATLNEPLSMADREVSISCSAGISHCPEHGQDLVELLRNCNSALNRAQARGGNSCAVFDTSMREKTEHFLSVESAMRQGLKNNEFELFYQPKLCTSDLSCAGAEALIRWRRDGKLISPAEFIPVAEESGLILPLGEWVMGEACRQWTEWRRSGLSPPPIAINVSAQQFQSVDFVAVLEETLNRWGMPAAMLELEITEEATFDDPHKIAATMAAAKAIGVSLALDDFGTGYSSLSCLTSFPLDVIKIDQKFVCEMKSSPRIMAVVEVICALGRELGFKIVAEGVETNDQEVQLRRLGCDMLQGYLYSRPVEATEYADYFSKTSVQVQRMSGT